MSLNLRKASEIGGMLTPSKKASNVSLLMHLFKPRIRLPYPTDRKERHVIRKLQRGLSSLETWRERWNIKINEDMSQAIYFSCGNGPAETHLTLKGWNITFDNQVKHPDVIFVRRVTLRYYTTMIEA
jgi:hypothetical protein